MYSILHMYGRRYALILVGTGLSTYSRRVMSPTCHRSARVSHHKMQNFSKPQTRDSGRLERVGNSVEIGNVEIPEGFPALGLAELDSSLSRLATKTKSTR